jgi:hypothetical protein
MGFIEETGAAQHFRDARITTIYEGTTGIQALDLIGRKVARDGGTALKHLVAQMMETQKLVAVQPGESFKALAAALQEGIAAVTTAGTYIVAHYAQNVRSVAVGAVPFLRLLGIVSGGWMMAGAALAAQAKMDAGNTDSFYAAKINTAHFYADHVMTAASGLAKEVVHGGESALALDDVYF